jgi:NAD(P)-dependent dehydrogenase (short-subunit alcohol dehydrogenase family)
MTREHVPAILVGGEPAFAEGLAAALHAPAERLAVEALDGAAESLAGRLHPSGLVWVHLAPSLPAGEDVFAEAALVRRSSRVAREVAAAAGVGVTFVAVLPAPGLFTGERGAACDVALTSATSLMRTEIGTWSSGGRRIVGLVYAGVEGHAADGLRDLEAVRQRTPMGALARFEHLAGVVRFVASPRAAYVTGTLLHVDGGCAAYSWMYPARTI